MYRHCLIVVAACVFSGCASAHFDPNTEEAKLLRRDAEWSDAAAHKDVEKTLSFWSDDAVVIPPAQPVLEGKAAIRGFVTSSFQIPEFSIRWKSDRAVFSADGTMAYMRGTNEMAVLGPAGSPLVFHGRGMTVWRLEPGGAWRCVVDIWNARAEASSLSK